MLKRTIEEALVNVHTWCRLMTMLARARFRASVLVVHEGGLLPRGCGVAWWHHNTATALVLPIPLNLLAGGLHRLWLLSKHGWGPSAYTRGYQRGRLVVERAWRIEREHRGGF